MLRVCLLADGEGIWADLFELVGGTREGEGKEQLFIWKILLEGSSQGREVGIASDQHCDIERVPLCE